MKEHDINSNQENPIPKLSVPEDINGLILALNESINLTKDEDRQTLLGFLAGTLELQLKLGEVKKITLMSALSAIGIDIDDKTAANILADNMMKNNKKQ